MESTHKAGFVNIFGLPNAGKSTLINALIGEQLAIVSPKAQTTRHRILGFLSEPGYQIIFSDTPGIIDPKYKLHTKMMMQVQNALKDTDVALIVMDIEEDIEEFNEMVLSLKINAPSILLVNKIDKIKKGTEIDEKITLISQNGVFKEAILISALNKINIDKIVPAILKYLPESPPYYPDDNISDRPVRFFVSEMIREQIYYLYGQEIPYHTAVLIQSFEEKPTITKIRADIIVTRETQKMILLGQKGAMIKKLGSAARKNIEQFLDQKVYLELFVKVRPKWRENDNYLREYGY